jgi:two-component system NtrC family sensor kinase
MQTESGVWWNVSEKAGDSGYRYYVSLWLPAAVLGGLLMLVLVVQLVLSWVAHAHLAPVSSHLAQMNRLQVLNFEMQQELLEGLDDAGMLAANERERMRDEISGILDLHANLSDVTPPALAGVRDVLADQDIKPGQALVIALTRLRKVIDTEAAEHRRLIDDVSRSTAVELEIGVVALLVLPASAILLIYLLRRRILEPLKHLGFLMTLLGRKNYAPASLASIDPMLRPLTGNYNTMVTRLAELEAEHGRREQDLESQVENATRVLLEQQRRLANTERLAALGEMMARIAHELRNPLAGVKLACTNLRQELDQQADSDGYRERIDAVAGEIDRIITLLNSLLDRSRHSPEAMRDVVLARAASELIALARYQIPPRIHIEQVIPDSAVCRLPDALLRQALLNLLLNASQALADKAGNITIKADVADGLLRLDVCDDGPGFPGDLLKSGIRAFVTHRAGGTGLGLSMVERFARACGGTITLSNREPHGACVTLELPCGRKEHA